MFTRTNFALIRDSKPDRVIIFFEYFRSTWKTKVENWFNVTILLTIVGLNLHSVGKETDC